LAQPPRQANAAEIKLELKKLNVLASVLYVAAHPDDENTRAIAYFSNERLATTGYLSMTRGDGGQNLIGPEIRDLLGLIRTQELLAARRIDGGQQFFTRANDFGYSKNATETLKIWGKDTILSDVVKVFREFKPDIILTRFPPDERAGHGHHTSSALLAQEAFEVAASPAYLPDQVKAWGTWQPKSLYTNTGRWWNQSINENTPGIISIDVGAYNSLLGKSYSEMSAQASSQHKSQGFGQAGRRGEAFEFFEYMKGEKAQKDFFENINTTWTRVKGGEKIKPLVEKAITEFKEDKPEESLPALLSIRKEILSLEAGLWKDRKLAEVNKIIMECLGLYAEVKADNYWVPPSESVSASFEFVNRSTYPVKLLTIKSSIMGYDTTVNKELNGNKSLQFKSFQKLNASATYSDPYWLRQPHTQGSFRVPSDDYIGLPQNPPAVTYTVSFSIGTEKMEWHLPLIYKWADPVKGELWRPLEIVPPVFINFQDKVIVFKDQSPVTLTALVKSASENKIQGKLHLVLPAGWRAEPEFQNFELSKRGEERAMRFSVFPSAKETFSKVKAVADINGVAYSHAIQTISYDHIPVQTLLPASEATVVRLDLKKEGALIGYVKGAGDDIPQALRHMGYEVWEMKNEEVTPENLKKLDAVVLGVRALNTNERLKYFMPDLLNFVKAGGTMVVQYNTNFDFEIDKDKFSPYALNISRNRVTEESSEVKILKPDHPLLNVPNKISAKDFEGWVQERGLYFPDKWDPGFEALLSMHDEGEPARDGALLVANYGEGHYVYTGLSFFRELPEGIPGAYKLFANIVSLGAPHKPQNQKLKAK